MKVIQTEMPGVLIVESKVFADARGFFMETYHKLRCHEAGLDAEFVQDNHSKSTHRTLRGLHYQLQNPQGKMCRVTRGEVFDVSVDLRRYSPTFGRWIGIHLSAANHRQVYIPPGMAHGFCVLSDEAEFLYKCTRFYHPEDEHTLLWNDPELGIKWPILDPVLSQKDEQGLPFRKAPCYETVPLT